MSGDYRARLREEKLKWLRNKKYSVYFLQEVHSSKETEKFWLAEWGCRGLFSSLSNSRDGVCILLNKNFSFEILKYSSDPEGTFISVDIKTEDKIDQFRFIKIQLKTIDLSTRLRGITTEFVGFTPQSLVLRSIVFG